MPIAPKKLCRAPGCTVLTHNGYCEIHAHIPRDKERIRKQKYDASKPSWHNLYNLERWKVLRRKFLFVHPECAECKKCGLSTVATVVDHIVPHRGNLKIFWDIDNLQSLCKSCHDRKTSREDSWN